jgi:RNA polymerase sigma-70 factor, ECF subfamily
VGVPTRSGPTCGESSGMDDGSIQRSAQDPEDQLVRAIYDELRRIAARMMLRERPDHTLQPSALVHEALIRLFAGNVFDQARDRQQVLAAAVQAMRQVLIDHHRHRHAVKRGGGWQRHPLDAALDYFRTVQGLDFAALHEALDRLAALSPRQALVVNLHFFLGLSLDEVAETLGVSVKTVERDWRLARAWLRDQLGGDGA